MYERNVEFFNSSSSCATGIEIIYKEATNSPTPTPTLPLSCTPDPAFGWATLPIDLSAYQGEFPIYEFTSDEGSPSHRYSVQSVPISYIFISPNPTPSPYIVKVNSIGSQMPPQECPVYVSPPIFTHDDAAQCIDEKMLIIPPGPKKPGEKFLATVVYKNVGYTSLINGWDSAGPNPHLLGASNPHDTLRWKVDPLDVSPSPDPLLCPGASYSLVNRVPLNCPPNSYQNNNLPVKPGEEAVFKFVAQVPDESELLSGRECTRLSSNSYECDFAWDMVQEGKRWLTLIKQCSQKIEVIVP